MFYQLLTNLTVLLHFAFLLFVVLGGFASHRYRRLTPLHLLAVAWGVYVEAMPGLRCPLTALENSFAVRAGGAGYEGGFIQHYLVPILYPEGLTPRLQLLIDRSFEDHMSVSNTSVPAFSISVSPSGTASASASIVRKKRSAS